MAQNCLSAMTFSCILLLTACSYNPFSTNNNLTGSAGATALGAGIGAGSAALLHVPKAGIIAAGIGGAAIGYYVTTLDFASGGVKHVGGQVFSEGDFVTINIPTDNLFDTNSSDLLPQATYVLDSAVAVLKRYPDTNIFVSANTSGFGTQKFQQRLSEARARQVAAYLWANGINNFKNESNDTRKLTYTGFGNQFPIANDINMDSLRQNSRIQITAYPSKNDVGLGKPEDHVFRNIGALHEPPLSPYKSTAPTNNSGSQRLSENDPPNLSSSLKENKPVASSYNDSASLKDERTIPNYNNVASVSQTTAGGNVVAKQGGTTPFKGDNVGAPPANLKGEV